MPPLPKTAATRQRRNRVSSAATFEAPQATKVPLPERKASWWCVAIVDLPGGCPLASGQHDMLTFLKREVQPHAFEAAVVPWHPLAVQWWDVVWASPMAREEWIDADVPNLLMLVALVDEYWRFGDAKIAAEVRMQSREFGITPMSRRSLQWEIKRLTEADKTPGPAVRPRSPRRAAQTLSVLSGGKS